jgi:catechol 2,3-dioxygenase-like lactoylglutathione lyase family enzyme
MILRLAHICFRTRRFAEMSAFYGDILGLKQQFTLDLPDGTVFGRYFALGGTSFLELFDDEGAGKMWGHAQPERRQHADSCYQHFCLQVEGIEALREKLLPKLPAITAVALGMDGSKQCWIKDPDGNDIELMEYTPQSKQTAQ